MRCAWLSVKIRLVGRSMQVFVLICYNVAWATCSHVDLCVLVRFGDVLSTYLAKTLTFNRYNNEDFGSRAQVWKICTSTPTKQVLLQSQPHQLPSNSIQCTLS